MITSQIAEMKYVRPRSFGRLLHRQKGVVIGVCSVVIILALWETVVDVGLVNPLFLAPPSAIVRAGVDAFWVKGFMYGYILDSARVGLIGFVLGLIGIPIGIFMAQSPFFRNALDPFMTALYTTPTIAFLPLIIIWLGIGLKSMVFLVFLSVFFVFVINTETGAASVDPDLIETAKSFRFTQWEILTKVTLPSIVRFLIAACRICVGRVLIMVFVAEMFIGQKGVGYFVVQSGNKYQMADVFLGIILFAAAGIILTKIVRYVEVKLIRWEPVQ